MNKRVLVTVSVTLLVMLAAVPVMVARAAMLTVDTTADDLPSDADNGHCSLREAVEAANTNTAVDSCLEGSDNSLDIIQVPVGTYTLGPSGPLTIIDNTASFDLQIEAAGAGTVTIQGGGSRVINNDATTKLNNLTVTGGGGVPIGGGIFNDGLLALANTTVSANDIDISGSSRGGGIYNSTGASLTLIQSRVLANAAELGGGIYNDHGTVLVQNGSIIGGDTIAEKNSAFGGAGIYNDGGTVTIDASAVSGNVSSGSGGGIYDVSGTVTVQNGSTISSNAAGGGGVGGGINNNGGMVTVQGGSAISSNSAGSGGGITNAGTLVVQGGSTISSNSAIGGGGIYNIGTLTVQGDSTISSNSAGSGGGIYNTGTLTIDSSRLLSNTVTASGGAIFNVTSTSVTSSCIVGNGGSALYSLAGVEQTEKNNWWGRPGGPGSPGTDNKIGQWTNGSFQTSPSLTGCSDHLTVLGGGTGSGAISDTTPGGEIACTSTAGTVTGDCEAWRVAGSGTIFTLTANPDPGSVFSGWTGCPSASGSTCTITLTADTTVTANFSPPCGIANCSFESPGGANQFPDTWKRGGLKLNVDGTDTTFKNDGAQSFRFSNPKAKAKKLWQDVAISGPAGPLTLTFDWSSSGVSGRKGLFRVMAVLYYTKGGSGRFYVNMPVGASNNWTSYSLPITAKKPYKKLRVEIDFGKAGTAWFDNFALN